MPISIKPKPKFANSEICVAFLSNPAAIPIGLGKVNPNNFLFSNHINNNSIFFRIEYKR